MLILVSTVVTQSFEEERWKWMQRPQRGASKVNTMQARQARLFLRTVGPVLERQSLADALEHWRDVVDSVAPLPRSVSEETPSEASSSEGSGQPAREFLDVTFLGEQRRPPPPHCGGRELPSKTGATRPKLTGVFEGLDDDADREEDRESYQSEVASRDAPSGASSDALPATRRPGAAAFPGAGRDDEDSGEETDESELESEAAPAPSNKPTSFLRSVDDSADESYRERGGLPSKLSSFLRGASARDDNTTGEDDDDDVPPTASIDERPSTQRRETTPSAAPASKLSTFVRDFPSRDPEPSAVTPTVAGPYRGTALTAFLSEVTPDGRRRKSESQVSELTTDDALEAARDDRRPGSTSNRALLAVSLALRSAWRGGRVRSLTSSMARWRLASYRLTELEHRERERELAAKLDELVKQTDVAVVSSSSSVADETPQRGRSDTLLLVVKRTLTRRKAIACRRSWTRWRKLGDGRWYDDEVRLAHRALFETHRVRERRLLLRVILTQRWLKLSTEKIFRAWRRWSSSSHRDVGRQPQQPPRSSSRPSVRPPPNRDGLDLLGGACKSLHRATLRAALGVFRARCAAATIGRYRGDLERVEAKVEANGFENAELRELQAIAQAELQACRDRASREVDAAWRQAAASDAGHAAQSAAFAALVERCTQLERRVVEADRTGDLEARLAALDERERQLEEDAAHRHDLEAMLVNAKVEIATLKAAVG